MTGLTILILTTQTIRCTRLESLSALALRSPTHLSSGRRSIHYLVGVSGLGSIHGTLNSSSWLPKEIPLLSHLVSFRALSPSKSFTPPQWFIPTRSQRNFWRTSLLIAPMKG